MQVDTAYTNRGGSGRLRRALRGKEWRQIGHLGIWLPVATVPKPTERSSAAERLKWIFAVIGFSRGAFDNPATIVGKGESLMMVC